MRIALTIVLSALVAVLSAHLVVVSLFPNVIAAHYPAFAARVYDAKAGMAAQEGAARLEPIDARPGISRVILTRAAVDRLALETIAVQERPVQRTRSIAGAVIAGSAAPKTVPGDITGGGFIVRVPLSGAVDTPATGEVATVHLLAGTKPAAAGATGNSDTAAAGIGAKSIGVVMEETARGPERNAYYLLPADSLSIQPGSLVMVQLPLGGTGTIRRLVPASTVLYDPAGRTWVYTNPDTLTYVREPVEIDAMEGETAILKSGPAVGTLVVKTGAYELFGAESAIGIEKVAR